MTAPPLRTALSDTYPAPSNATMRTGMGVFWDYVTGLLGATGNAAEARAALGVTRNDYIYIRDEKANGTNAGSSVVGYQARTLNTEVSDIGGNAALSSNQITLAAGTYRVRARAPGYRAGLHRIRLRNVTSSSTLLVGAGSFAETTATQMDAFMCGRITVAAGQALEVQHYISSAVATGGLGNAVTSGESEIYAEIEFWRES
jgi:hypothetical protein